jgi:glutaminase
MDFDKLKEVVEIAYNKSKLNESGAVADYIPQLGTMNPDLYGISVCSVDGEIFNIGDTNPRFCLQSCSKPLNYCIARDNYGLDKIHKHVGYEPSGQEFNAHVLNRNGLPHNPMINAGAIMVASLIDRDKEPADRFELVKTYYDRMAGNLDEIGFDNGVFLSEQHHADRNMSLAFYMRENKAFGVISPEQIKQTLDLYFQCCSITINTKIGSVIAGTLAKGGICPITEEKVFSTSTARDCLCLMFGCGMYDFSGQFAFEIGLPAKSGVSGCLLLVIPNVAGICIWSPRLDTMGNSVRGVDFCHHLIKESPFKLHMFQSIFKNTTKISLEDKDDNVLVHLFISAAASGDLDRLKELEGKIDFNCKDYDNRTALHLAASDGQVDVVKYLLKFKTDSTVKDRWGNTPYHEAHKNIQNNGDNYSIICDLLSS